MGTNGPAARWVAGLLLLMLLSFAAAQAQAPSSARVEVDFSKRQQVMDGFGVNFNATYFRDAQKPMIDLLINDLGATIFRLDPYGLLNWEAANDDDNPKHMNWEYYNDRYSTPPFEASWAAPIISTPRASVHSSRSAASPSNGCSTKRLRLGPVMRTVISASPTIPIPPCMKSLPKK